MAVYKTPGVYVEEISKIPPSVAGVATAIPGFVGITEKEYVAEDNPNKVVKIESLLDFEEKFGGAQKLSVNKDGELQGANFVLYDSIRLFYDNGGSTCFIVSIGDYNGKEYEDVEKYKKGIEELNKEDSITMILAPDAAMNLKTDELGTLHKFMLKTCGELGDRVAILDVKCSNDIDNDMKNFRTGTGTNNLSYGAAYYPDLRTTYAKHIDFMKMIDYAFNKNIFTDEEKNEINKDILGKAPSTSAKNGKQETSSIPTVVDVEAKAHCIKKMEAKPEYQKLVTETLANANIIPPSGAIAGIYCMNDAKSGVWQSPANKSLSSVSDVKVRISDHQQEDINVDANNGKSVNAIRLFEGKGIIVWGARTLDGFSNEWRYISVRRLFNYVEESVKKSTSWAVFQPNDANTWVNVQCQIENFLSNLWRDGALAGSTPAQAFRVGVGLNVTMTAQDILEGKLIVEIAMAAVRPAEFIILRFSHKLQEA